MNSKKQKRKELSYETKRQIRFAEGWRELKLYAEAHHELNEVEDYNERISYEFLSEKFMIHLEARELTSAEHFARMLTEHYPEEPSSWNLHARAIGLLRGTKAEYAVLTEANLRFPEDPGTCYRCAAACARLWEEEKKEAYFYECHKYLQVAFNCPQAEMFAFLAEQDKHLSHVIKKTREAEDVSTT